MSASEDLRCAPKYTISKLNNQNFSGEGAQPPRPAGRGTPLPGGERTPRFSRLRRSSPPLKNPGYAPATHINSGFGHSGTPYPLFPSSPLPSLLPFPRGPNPLNQLGGLGSAKLPSSVWGKAPAYKRFGAYLSQKEQLCMVATVFVHFHKNKFKFMYKHCTNTKLKSSRV